MRKTYEMEPNRLTLETMLRTIAAAWKCEYVATHLDNQNDLLLRYAAGDYRISRNKGDNLSVATMPLHLLHRDRKPLALVERAEEEQQLSPQPPRYVDLIQLSRLTSLAAETTIPAALMIRTESGIAVLITRGEPSRGSISVETIAGQPRAAVEIEPSTWKLIPLPNSQTWRHYETARPRS